MPSFGDAGNEKIVPDPAQLDLFGNDSGLNIIEEKSGPQEDNVEPHIRSPAETSGKGEVKTTYHLTEASWELARTLKAKSIVLASKSKGNPK